MKKLLLGLLLISLTACSTRGEIDHQPTDFIIIHNKTYKLMSIVPCGGCNSIWIMYPKDSTDAVPTSIGWVEQQGKVRVQKTVIKVD